jgi:hypothetical protein
LVALLSRIDHFFEKAGRFILEKDKEWQKKSQQCLQRNYQNHEQNDEKE